MVVYDPFMGSGTTNVTAKSMGIDSIGTEAHPFVYEIAKAKMEWEVDGKEIRKFIHHLNENFESRYSALTKAANFSLSNYFPELVIKEVYRVLKPGSSALFVLGDSAPYGVHIPTDRLIGEIGCSIGFKSYSLEVLRKRGDKWKANPQRHGVSLQESIVILKKK